LFGLILSSDLYSTNFLFYSFQTGTTKSLLKSLAENISQEGLVLLDNLSADRCWYS
jgi:hypothetical protein